MPDTDLHQLGVLVTRPAQQAEGLCKLIQQAGGRAYSLPLIKISPPEDEPGLQKSLSQLADVDIVIFISANAVHRSTLYIGKDLPVGPSIACVGQATARQLEQEFGRGADLIPNEGYDSEALLAMAEFQAVAGKKILLMKGEGGREALANTLADRGAVVSYANLYRRELPEEAGQQLRTVKEQNKIDVVILTSGESIHNLLSLLDETSRQWLSQVTWLVIHPRLADIARQAGCYNEMIISDGPGNEQIIQCLKRWALQK